ncbi:hypothetical protein JHN63_13855 [Streptomyces sp. MBT65]|uniref:hypothetical protein n=1 Tax=Streptomyces sp. MBT65 TaxID=1488395 RepID=UPI00190B0959|nr:hypothetical protein [Streptomyces sp. MBT65]MBK3574881.1 hypothetical protein [Streptomyces sp. MBT65]
MGTTFRTAAVSALALGSLTVAAGSQVHAATATSHSTKDDSARIQKQKAEAVAAAAESQAQATSPSTKDDSARAQKQKAEAVAAAAEGQTPRPVTDPEAVRTLKMKVIAMAHAPKG